MKIRLINAGLVSAWRSQSIYHALGYTLKPDSPDTIVIATPTEPYVSIGLHRSLENEIDQKHCQRAGLPIIRRETGGGPVYLDNNQLFVQWIFSPANLPKRVDARFRLFCQTLIETYRFFEIKAAFSEPNDIVAGNRKITGTGAGAIGEAEVLTGNFLFDFDVDAMIRVLQYPDDAFREMAREGMQKYLSHFSRECKSPPSQEDVASKYAEKCAEILDRPIETGYFTEEEEAMMTEIETRFASEAWLNDPHGGKKKPKRLVKIHAGVWVGETRHQSASGAIAEAVMRSKNGRIDALKFKDGTPMDLDGLDRLERILKGVDIQREPLHETIGACLKLHGLRSPGFEIEDWVETIMQFRQFQEMR